MKLEPAQAELKCIVDCPYAEKLQEKRVNDKLKNALASMNDGGTVKGLASILLLLKEEKKK